MPIANKVELDDSNRIVNGLWIGGSLSNLELLTIHSFTQHGHEFHLWLYGPLTNPLPQGVIIKDANEIIPNDKIFRYEESCEYGHGKDSLAGFSDIFRYKLLLEKGGWWVDMDVTCLRPFDFSEPYVFRAHDVLEAVGNIIKVPAGSELMRRCFKQASESINSRNREWLKPIEILNSNIKELGLRHFIKHQIAPPDNYSLIKLFKSFPFQMKPEIYMIHWLNEMWRYKKLDKNKYKINSNYGQNLIKYGVVKGTYSKLDEVTNSIATYSIFHSFYRIYLLSPFVYLGVQYSVFAIRKYILGRKHIKFRKPIFRNDLMAAIIR